MSTDKRCLYAKFLGKDILLEQGRLLFSLLNAFSGAGYHIKLHDNLDAGQLEKYGQMALELANVSLTDQLPQETTGCFYLFDEEDEALARMPWKKKVQVRFDVFSPYWFKQPVIMPFTVHPVHAVRNYETRLDEYRSADKNIRVFFSGDTKGYVRNRVRYPKPKLPRLEIINTLVERLGEETVVIKDLSALERMAQVYTNKCVIVDTGEIWVDDRYWFDNLARADFFLSPPGYVMPMCHNIVEAMAVGTIPITNYPEWLDPALTDMKNCIVFDDKADLERKIRFALAMDRDRISEMRANAIDYYESYIKPDCMVRRVESYKDDHVTVLMLTEGNMAKNAKRLGKHSVLMRGTTGSDDVPGWRSLLASLFSRA